MLRRENERQRRASDAIAEDDADGGELAELGGDLRAVIDAGVIGEARA